MPDSLMSFRNVVTVEGFSIPRTYSDDILERMDSDALTGVILPDTVGLISAGRENELSFVFSDLVVEAVNAVVKVEFVFNSSQHSRSSQFSMRVSDKEEGAGVAAEQFKIAVLALTVLVDTCNAVARESHGSLFGLTADIYEGESKIGVFSAGVDIAGRSMVEST